MAFSGGTFSRLYNFVNDRDAGIKILASRMDAELAGFATGLSTCLLKDGTQTVTANIPMATFKFTGLGAGTANGDSVRYEQVVLLSAGANQTITQSAAGTLITFESTDAGAGSGPNIRFSRNSASPAADDYLTLLLWNGRDSGGNATTYASQGARITSPTDTSESGRLFWTLMVAGADTEMMTLSSTGLSLGTSGVFTTGTIELGHASDTTLSRSAAGQLAIEGGAGSLYTATIELGAASDTTLARASAGIVSVEGVALARVNSTDADSLLDALGTEENCAVLWHNGTSWVVLAPPSGSDGDYSLKCERVAGVNTALHWEV